MLARRKRRGTGETDAGRWNNMCKRSEARVRSKGE